jgi:hypothetical protein
MSDLSKVVCNAPSNNKCCNIHAQSASVKESNKSTKNHEVLYCKSNSKQSPCESPHLLHLCFHLWEHSSISSKVMPKRWRLHSFGCFGWCKILSLSASFSISKWQKVSRGQMWWMAWMISIASLQGMRRSIFVQHRLVIFQKILGLPV